MTSPFFKKIDSWFFLIVMLLSGCICLGMPATGSTENSLPAAGNHADKNQELVITADRLDADINENYSEFSGNVKAVQGDAVITADRVRIYFKNNQDSSGQLGAGEDALEKITAMGHVEIYTGEITALTSKASYESASRLLVLSGPDSTVKSGKNSITGSRITLDRVSGRITVEKSPENQVRALIFTNEKVLN